MFNSIKKEKDEINYLLNVNFINLETSCVCYSINTKVQYYLCITVLPFLQPITVFSFVPKL